MEESESEEEFLSADEGGDSEKEELEIKQEGHLKQPRNKILKCFDNGDAIITKSKNENIYLQHEVEQSIIVKNESSIFTKIPSSYKSVENLKECSVESFVHENISDLVKTPFSSDNEDNSQIISSSPAIEKLDASEKEESEVLINDEKKQCLKEKDCDENEAENLLLENKCMNPSRLNECDGNAFEIFHSEIELSTKLLHLSPDGTEIPLIIDHPKNIDYSHSSCTSNELSLVSKNSDLFQNMNPDVFVVEKLTDNKPTKQFSQQIIINPVSAETDATNKTTEQLLQEIKEDPVVVLKFDSANESFKHDKSKSIAEAEVQLKNESSDDWGWDNWAEDIIQQATNKVSVLVETLEDKLGIPDPIEMAKFVNENFEKDPSTKDENLLKEYDNPIKEESLLSEKSAAHSGFSSWFSSFSPLTSIVQATGQDLVSGGIGALEFIGKKTVDILSDGDPGLRSVRRSFEKPTLSMALRDAKVRSELDECKKNDRIEESTSTFNDMFEKYQGSAHLDALEMLSNESEKKLQRILAMQSEEVKDESLKLLISIKAKFQLENTDKLNEDIDFKKDVIFISKKLNLKVTCSKLLNTWQKLKDNKNTFKHIDVVVSTLAELLSRFVEFFRKVADLLILTDVSAKPLAEERAAAFKLLAEVFVNEILGFANSYAEEIMENEKESALISDIYLEASNCATLLQNSYNLLLPILQCSAIK